MNEQLALTNELSEEQLNRFARMAAYIFDAPLAFISLNANRSSADRGLHRDESFRSTGLALKHGGPAHGGPTDR